VRSQTGVILTVLADPTLSENLDRVIAAIGVRALRAPTVPTRKAWAAAVAVVIDEAAAGRCERGGLPRRDAVILVVPEEPLASTWAAAMAVGAQHLCVLPAQEAELVRYLSEAAEAAQGGPRPGRAIAVIAGRGGAGASVFSAALAQASGDALLVDLDPWGGGIDLLLGGESVSGLRWPDLSLRGGRLAWSAVRDSLPRHRGVSVLSGTRRCHEMDAGPVEAVLDAGRRGGVTVISDVPRRMTEAATCALDCADLVVAITTCDVRGIAATSALVPVVRAINPNVGLVVRGPSPGGLRAGEAADVAAVPLLAAMRPEPMLNERVEQGGLRLRRRSPLGAAARRVLALLDHGAWVRAA